MIEPLIDAWRLNNRVDLYLLDALTDEQLDIKIDKGKDMRGQFAHLVNVRRMWLKMYARDLLDTDEKSDRRKASRDDLVRDLIATSECLARLLERAGSADGKIKGRKGSVAQFFAGMMAHEGYHRGQIELGMRQAGQELPFEVQLGVWEWDKR